MHGARLSLKFLYKKKQRKKQSERLQKIQNREARVITRSPYDILSSSLFDELNWEILSTNRVKQKAMLIHKP